MSYKIDQCVRVTARPVHSVFPYPLQPRFGWTDFCYLHGPANLGVNERGAETIETDLNSELVYARPILVPHNNLICDAGEYGGSYTEPDPLFSFVPFCWDIVSLSANGKVGASPGRAGSTHLGAVWFQPVGPGPGDTPPTQEFYEWDRANSFGAFQSETFNGLGFFGSVRLVNGWKWRLNEVDYEIDPEDFQGYASLRFMIANEDNNEGAQYFALVFTCSGQVAIWQADDFSFAINPRKIQDLHVVSDAYGGAGATTGIIVDSANQTGVVAYGAPLDFDVRLIGGILQVRIGGQDTPFLWDITSRDFNGKVVGKIRYCAMVGIELASMEWEVHPMKFYADAWLTSPEINIGFNPITDPEFDIRYGEPQPDGPTVDGEYALNGTAIQYQLLMTNPTTGTFNGVPYSDVTASIRAVTFEYEEVERAVGGFSTYLFPEEVVVNQSFNQGDLSVTQSATLVFRNFNVISAHPGHIGAPDAFWGEWANQAGALAVTIDMKVDWISRDGTDVGSTGWVKVFTGYGNLQSTVSIGAGGQSQYVMRCHGREISMQRDRFNYPWFDGWNNYAFAAYIANSTSVAIDDFNYERFGIHVPPDPYSESPSGLQAYFLPQGTGGSPLMRFPGGESPWSVLGKVGRQIGYVRYFDQDGKFVWEPFLPQANSPYRIFSVVDGVQLGDFPTPYSAILTGSVDRDLTQVRNKVTIIGVDAYGPLWNPIVAHRWDEASLFSNANSVWDPTAPNHVAYENPFVWMDSQFANLDFARDAADEVFNVMRLPVINSNYVTWMQPDIYPGYWLGFLDRRTGSYDFSNPANPYYLSYFVFGVTHRYRRGEVGTTTFNCRYLPPGNGLSL